MHGNDTFFCPVAAMADAERKLYGRHADRLMKTDVHEHDDHYEVDIDLPGFKKEEIKLELNNGYLTVGASKEHDQTNNGKAIRKERYSGSMSRSFYIGEGRNTRHNVNKVAKSVARRTF